MQLAIYRRSGESSGATGAPATEVVVGASSCCTALSLLLLWTGRGAIMRALGAEAAAPPALCVVLCEHPFAAARASAMAFNKRKHARRVFCEV